MGVPGIRFVAHRLPASFRRLAARRPGGIVRAFGGGDQPVPRIFAESSLHLAALLQKPGRLDAQRVGLCFGDNLPGRFPGMCRQVRHSRQSPRALEERVVALGVVRNRARRRPCRDLVPQRLEGAVRVVEGVEGRHPRAPPCLRFPAARLQNRLLHPVQRRPDRLVMRPHHRTVAPGMVLRRQQRRQRYRLRR